MKLTYPPEFKATKKAFGALLAKADRVCLHFNRVPESHEYGPDGTLAYANASVHVRCLRTVHGKDVEESLYMRAHITNGHNDEREEAKDLYGSGSYWRYTGNFRPVRGFWGIVYNVDNVRAALKALPANKEPIFRVYLDAHTNGYCVKNLLHADALFLGTVEVDSSVGEHNTARFGVNFGT